MFQLHLSLLSNGPSHFVSAGGSKEGVGLQAGFILL